MKTMTLSIQGMSCDHCVRAVEGALGSLPGVKVREVRVGEAVVEFDSSEVQPQDLVDAVEDQGYQAQVNAS
jgi:copper chaperone